MVDQSFSDARRLMERGETSCEALVSSFLERIQARNEQLNALIDLDEDGARNHARYLDSQIERGYGRSLSGLVLAVKDNIAIRGQRLACGSRMLAGFTSTYDAGAIKKLRDAGAIFVGRANCDEFAMGSSNETSHFGPVQHPSAPDRVPGGSSGGSAAAVAAGLCHAALGSDTGGSVRQPAAFCGVVGLKPTYGRVSRYGLVAYASSLDTVGPIARSVEDVAHLLGAIAGPDPADSTTADVPVPDYAAALEAPLDGVRVGLPREYFGDELDPGVRAVVEARADALREAGAEVVEASLPHTAHALATYYVIATAEASSNLARYDGVRYGHRAPLPGAQAGDGAPADTASPADWYAASRTEGFGDEVRRRILLGTYVLSAGTYEDYYAQAQRARTLVRHDFEQAFDEVDVLLAPTTPTTAFPAGSKGAPLAMYESDVYTVAANLAGIPALSVPGGTHPDDGLPVGVQLMGPHFDEARLLQVGAAVARLKVAA